MKPISVLWNRILNFGSTSETPLPGLEKIRMVNGISFIALWVHIIYLIGIISSGNQNLLVPNIAGTVVFLTPLVANGAKATTFAKWALLLLIGPLFTLKTFYLGLASGQQFALIICAVVPVMFGGKELRIWGLFAFNFILFVGITFYLTYYPALATFSSPLYFIFNLATIFLVMFLYVRYFQTENSRFRKELEEKNNELMVRNAELKEYNYALAHDLRSPIRGIIHLLEFAEEDGKDQISGDLQTHLAKIRHQAFRMEKLTAGILEYSAIDKHKKEPRKIPLRKILHKVKSEIESKTDHKIEVAANIPEKLLAVPRLPQVFVQLIDNSIKFHDKPSGIVQITYQKTDASYQFKVVDDGPGIPKRFHEKVFNLFETLSPKSASGDAGIGLAMAKKIVLEMGGSISLESEPGAGTSVLFSIPQLET